jgi:hypothetical protein
MVAVTNKTSGPKGAYLEGALVMAEPGQTIEADDFAAEWFEPVKQAKADPHPDAAVKDKAAKA